MNALINETENFVTKYINDHLDTSFVYHNIAHTQRVVRKVYELIEDKSITINDNEKQQLVIAQLLYQK